MAKLMEKLFPKAAAAGKTLILPEGMDPRVMKAAKIIADKKMAAVKILATPEEAAKAAEGISFAGQDVEIIDWTKTPYYNELAGILYLNGYAAQRLDDLFADETGMP